VELRGHQRYPGQRPRRTQTVVSQTPRQSWPDRTAPDNRSARNKTPLLGQIREHRVMLLTQPFHPVPTHVRHLERLSRCVNVARGKRTTWPGKKPRQAARSSWLSSKTIWVPRQMPSTGLPLARASAQGLGPGPGALGWPWRCPPRPRRERSPARPRQSPPGPGHNAIGAPRWIDGAGHAGQVARLIINDSYHNIQSLTMMFKPSYIMYHNKAAGLPPRRLLSAKRPRLEYGPSILFSSGRTRGRSCGPASPGQRI
jgi:hypothetical protein